jgi:hypothetical protein
VIFLNGVTLFFTNEREISWKRRSLVFVGQNKIKKCGELEQPSDMQFHTPVCWKRDCQENKTLSPYFKKLHTIL